MLITDYQKVKELLRDNLFLIDGESGTKTIIAEDLASELVSMLSSIEFTSNIIMPELSQTAEVSDNDRMLLGTTDDNKALLMKNLVTYLGTKPQLYFDLCDLSCEDKAVSHRVIRRKNLGDTFTQEQKKNIANGSFKDLFLGDYWIKDGKQFEIVDFNYYTLKTDSGWALITTPHIVVMPSWKLFNSAFCVEGATTCNGYQASSFNNGVLSQALAIFGTVFNTGSRLYHTNKVTNAASETAVTGAQFVDSSIILPNQAQIFGRNIYTNGLALDALNGTQFALFAQGGENFIIQLNGDNFWTCDMLSNKMAVAITAHHLVQGDMIGNTGIGVRPVVAYTGL